jgi:alpha-beta hydrolase superfamily lysophospholipase
VSRFRLGSVVALVTIVAAAAMSAAAGAATGDHRRDHKTVAGAPGVALGPSGNAFYDPPSKLPKGQHGKLIWARPIAAPQGAKAWKILYLSTVQSGARVAVSGFVVAPTGRAPRGGRPVLAWAHGTEGTARNCAPSMAPRPARDLVDYFTYSSTFQQDVGVPALTDMVRAGYVVVATDYQGLGTPGAAQYTVMGSQSRNFLDSVLAARSLKPTRASTNVVSLGWSQGGGAALWAAQAPGYAPGLKVLGTAALAPATDTGPQFAGQVAAGPQTPTSPAHAVAIRLNVYRGFAAAYPELDPAQVVAPAGMSAYAGAGVECINHLAYVINSNVTDLEALFVPSVPAPANWQKRFDENTLGLVPSTAPVLVMQGTADTVINPNGTAQYIQRACGLGGSVEYTTYAGANHQTIPNVAQGEYLSWIADRFAGKPAPSNCTTGG